MKRFLPLLVFMAMAILLAIPLVRKSDPSVLPSALIGKPAPVFRLPLLADKTGSLSNADLRGHVSVVNIFASWCVPCRAEQASIVMMKQRTGAIFYGISYKDKEEASLAFLKEEGDPYALTGVDATGRAAIEWGVYGVPETFVIDRNGIIRYRHAGPVTMDDAKNVLIPLIEDLSR